MAQENKPEDNEPDLEEEEDFLQRWSRRKHEVLQEQEPADDNKAVSVSENETNESESVRILTDEDMVPIDQLTEESDFSPFLSPGVSDGLRKKALRKLFGQPAFNVTDSLDDYAEDFTEFEGLGSVITHEMKRALQRELDKVKQGESLSSDETDKTASMAETTEKVDLEESAQEVEPGDNPDQDESNQ